MNNQSFSKIWILAILVILIAGGILVWQYFGAPEKTEAPGEETLETIQNETANWKTYRNKEYGFEFKYPDDWLYFEKEEKHKELLNGYGWVYYVDLRPKDKEYSYEGTEECPVNIRILNKLDKFDDDFRNSFSQEEKFDLIINNIPATKFITKMGEDTAWELTITEESNNLGYYFEFFNPIYVLSDGVEEDYLLGVFDKILSTFRFLE